MTRIDFNAEFARYLSLRASLGIPTYQFSPVLEKFIKYLNTHCDGVVRVHHVLDWVCSGSSSTATQHVHLSAARVFLKHLKAIVPETEIPSSNLIARHHRPEPFVFSVSQLIELLNLAGRLKVRRSVAPLTIQTMLGLMACTGLRPSEVLRLKTAQVFLDEHPPRLLIFKSKFQKSRWVPLHPTAVQRLRIYLLSREQQDYKSNAYFFISKRGKEINRITFHQIFRALIAQSTIRSRKGQLRPSPHSLRHTFAVHRLEHWYRNGDDVRRLMPSLSVYMGHVDPASSYWYLSCTPELMTAAAHRFEVYAGKEAQP